MVNFQFIYIYLVASIVSAVRLATASSLRSTSRITRAEDMVPCLTRGECESSSQEMGYDLFYVDEDNSYPTKGCWAKNGKVFFSVGTTSQMSTANHLGIQERILCKKKKISSHTACLTIEECKARSQALGIYFYNNDYDTKGCFTKTSLESGTTNAFFSKGTVEQMSTSTISAPLQERLWCDEEASQTDDTITTTTSAPSATKLEPTTPKPTPQPSKLPTKEPTKVSPCSLSKRSYCISLYNVLVLICTT